MFCNKTMSCSYRYEHWPWSSPPPPPPPSPIYVTKQWAALTDMNNDHVQAPHPHPHPPFMWQNNELLLQIWTLTMFKPPTPTPTPHLCDKTMSCSYRYKHWPCSSHHSPPPLNECSLICLLVSLTLEMGVNWYVRTWLFFQKTRRRIWTKG